MANIKSAKKRVKVIARKTLRNKSIKSNLKTVLKKADAAVASGGGAETESAIKLAVKKVDQAAAKGIIHKNKASRKKSQLAKKLNSLNS
jgi:small subunit ribosomal protein S20